MGFPGAHSIFSCVMGKSHAKLLFSQSPQNPNLEWDTASLVMHEHQLKLISMDGKFNLSFTNVHFLKLCRNYLLLIVLVSCQAWQNSHPSPAVFRLLPYQVNTFWHPMVLLGHNCAASYFWDFCILSNTAETGLQAELYMEGKMNGTDSIV